MTTVWVLSEHVDNEGTAGLGVYSTLRTAQAVAEEMVKRGDLQTIPDTTPPLDWETFYRDDDDHDPGSIDLVMAPIGPMSSWIIEPCIIDTIGDDEQPFPPIDDE